MIIVLALLALVLFVVNTFFIYDNWQYGKQLRKDRKLDEEEDIN